MSVLLWVLAGLALFAVSVLSKRAGNMMFGGKIIKTWDSEAPEYRIWCAPFKVHAIQITSTRRLVGLDFSPYESEGGLAAIALSVLEARELSRMLTEAVDKLHAVSEP